jgi:hypothetical protein
VTFRSRARCSNHGRYCCFHPWFPPPRSSSPTASQDYKMRMTPSRALPFSNPPHPRRRPGHSRLHSLLITTVRRHAPLTAHLLQRHQAYRKLHRHPMLLADPRVYSGSHPFAPPSTTSPPQTSLPSTALLGEPPSCQPPPTGSPWSRLPPWQLLVRRAPASRYDFIGKAVDGKGERPPLFTPPWVERPRWAGPSPYWLGRIPVRVAPMNSDFQFF